ncbi:MAG: glycogen synthase GlgA [Bauldia sp.]
MTRVLAVASEVYPLVKTGGLADVVGALPAALKAHGIDMRVMVPGYPAVMAGLSGRAQLRRYDALFGGRATLVAGRAGNLDLIALDAPGLFDRPGNPYLGPDGADWPDNWRRFAALSRAAADLGEGKIAAFVPEVVLANDWQAALTAAYLNYAEGHRAKAIVAIHNLAFQGNFPGTIFAELGLPPSAFALDGVEYYGGVSYLKGGLQLADAIVTVSPSYAAEICTPAGGMGLDGLLRSRRSALTGILNGIDTEVWNPHQDANLEATFDSSGLGRRAENRRAVETAFGLEAGDGPLFAVISRLTWQKGMDVLGAGIDGLTAAGGRLALLGSGDTALEGMFRAVASRTRGRVGVVIGYDERLSHLLQGGADAILVPSRFEPCGLTQFCGLRYGCVPVVSRVGGLADSVIDANDAAVTAGVATGIQFQPLDAAGLESAIMRTMTLYRERKVWTRIQRQGMKTDVSWRTSAARYAALFRGVASQTGAA